MKIAHQYSMIEMVGGIAATALWPSLALNCAKDQFTKPFIGMNQVTRNGP